MRSFFELKPAPGSSIFAGPMARFNIFQRVSQAPTNPHPAAAPRTFDVADLYRGPVAEKADTASGGGPAQLPSLVKDAMKKPGSQNPNERPGGRAAGPWRYGQ